MPAKIDRLSDRAIARCAALAPSSPRTAKSRRPCLDERARVPEAHPHGRTRSRARRWAALRAHRRTRGPCSSARWRWSSGCLPGLAYPWPSPWEPIGTRNWFEAHTTPTEAAVSWTRRPEYLLSVMASDHARAVFSVRAGRAPSPVPFGCRPAAPSPPPPVLTRGEAARDVPGATFADVLSERPGRTSTDSSMDGRVCAWLPVPRGRDGGVHGRMLSPQRRSRRGRTSRAPGRDMADVVTGTVDRRRRARRSSAPRRPRKLPRTPSAPGVVVPVRAGRRAARPRAALDGQWLAPPRVPRLGGAGWLAPPKSASRGSPCGGAPARV